MPSFFKTKDGIFPYLALSANIELLQFQQSDVSEFVPDEDAIFYKWKDGIFFPY
jgi:hypothetical protein